jgi:hypothetical protein
MARYVLCCLGMLALSLPAWGGELDNEKTPSKSVRAGQQTAASKVATPLAAKTTSGSELDKEAPQQSWRCGRCCWGCRRCYHGCGFGCCPTVSICPSYCCYQPCYTAVYGGIYGW